MEKIAFCLYCNDLQNYDIDSRKIILKINDIIFSYNELYAYCKKCGHEIYVPSINDKNVDNRLETYLKAKSEKTKN